MLIADNKLLNPKIDYVFKRIFGYAGNEDITKALLEAVLNAQISEITLECNPILEKDLYDDKVGILDIRAKLDGNTDCDIEMQIVDYKNIEKRLLYYWSKLYIQGLKSGMDYEKLNKAIIVLFADFEIEHLSEIKKSITKWNLREEEYPKSILTNAIEIYIIELPKFKADAEKLENKELDLWIKFIKNPEVISMKNTQNTEVKKAKEVLEQISNDEYERYLADLREKMILDKKSLESYGYNKGLEDGLKEKSIEIAKKLLAKKIDIEIIMETTGLSKEEIETII